jgi:energy-converting hydrogenase Eha subunit B
LGPSAVRGGVRRGREEGWVVNPTFVVVNVFLDLLDDVVEGADGPGEVIRVKFGDCSILGGTLVGVVFCRFDETDEQLVREKAMYVGKRGIFPAWSLNQSLVFLLVTRLKRVMMQL